MDDVLLPHQANTVRFFLDNKLKSFLVFYGTGQGKTYVGVAAMAQSPYKRCLLLTKASLRDVWIRHMSIPVFAASIAKKKVNIVNYDGSISTDIPIANSLIVIDECHNFFSRASNSTEQIYDSLLRCNACKVMLLTATPILNNIKDGERLLRFLRPNLFDEVAYDDIIRYARIGYPRPVSNRLRFCCSSIGITTLASFESSRATKVLPQKKVKVWKLAITDDQHIAQYIEASKAESGFRSRTRSVIQYNSRSSKLETVADHKKKSIKFYSICDHIKKHAKKSFLFMDRIENGINILCKYLEFFGISYLEVSGRITSARRSVALEMFNSPDNILGKKYQCIIISSAGLEGLTLKEVLCVYVLTIPWNEALLQQIIGRAIRYKSHERLPAAMRTATVFICVATISGLTSIDEILFSLCSSKYYSIKTFYNCLINSSIEKMHRRKLEYDPAIQQASLAKTELRVRPVAGGNDISYTLDGRNIHTGTVKKHVLFDSSGFVVTENVLLYPKVRVGSKHILHVTLGTTAKEEQYNL